jgi:phosphopantetheine--protein transferase-like protein
MKEVVGCGIDIEELARFNTKIPIQEDLPGFAQMVYTTSEIECNLAIHPEVTFPLCFSCKEAFFKAFGVSWTNSKISWKDIELLFYNENNLQDYSVRLTRFAEELYYEKKCTGIESWIEYTNEYIIFQVILLS